ncbi:conidial pigment biosynthesis scytalone dehydratase Arp1 [Ophiocordyceps camponoti-floridani]|uniref:Conidial pigment biosynthesis scytalone dehydratase Arp1 n=1 Tax=Ophiocordyceps camponoti-floridani TaxID=2030778 RepID=A0A8H4Q154_9HYPO|nr:conidial pigment biosynthesis scytalone dehydratase Arp1 [Ophiocordyceps camponoti-floridani]
MVSSAAAGSGPGGAGQLSFQDYLELNDLLFEWGDSYDSKDWDRLRGIIAPTLYVDYSQIGKGVWKEMPAEEFMAMVSSDGFLGDPCVKTQHLLGATRWEPVSDTEVIGNHQLRAAHQVYEEPELINVKVKGHGHATNKHFYKKVDGVWKFAGLAPLVRWNEHEFEKVFKGSYLKEEAEKK